MVENTFFWEAGGQVSNTGNTFKNYTHLHKTEMVWTIVSFESKLVLLIEQGRESSLERTHIAQWSRFEIYSGSYNALRALQTLVGVEHHSLLKVLTKATKKN